MTTTKKAENPAAWDVVLIPTDDQPTGTLPSMPNVTRLLAGRGVDFTNAIVPTSLCCPSRTSLLTGQLATKTGIYSNESDTGYGGYPPYAPPGWRNRPSRQRWTKPATTPPTSASTSTSTACCTTVWLPGWDTWRVFTTKQSGRYRNFALADAVPFGQTPRAARQEFVRQYSTTHLGRLAADHIRTTPRDQPSFTVFAPYAPIRPSPPRRSTAARADCRPTT